MLDLIQAVYRYSPESVHRRTAKENRDDNIKHGTSQETERGQNTAA